MGRFDRKATGEKAMKRGGRRRQKGDNLPSKKSGGIGGAESQRSLKVLDRVLRGAGGDGAGVRVVTGKRGKSKGGKKRKR